MLELILAAATVLGGISSIWFFVEKFKSHDKKNISKNIISNKESKIVSRDIFLKIEPNTPLDLVREILGIPHKIYNSIFPAFSKQEINTKIWYYSFSNADIEIQSDDGETVTVITIQSHNIEPNNIFDIPYSEPIGKLTVKDVIQECDSKKIRHFTSMRDAYLAIECYKGGLGGYFTYTFGCYNHPDLLGSEVKKGKILDIHGQRINFSKTLINFVSISLEEKRGHPIAINV